MDESAHLTLALSVSMHETRLCSQRLRHRDVDRDQLNAHVHRVFVQIVGILTTVVPLAGLPPSSLTDPPDAPVASDGLDQHDLVETLQRVYGFATFIRGHVDVDEREYDVLAEYADGLHDELSHLMAELVSMDVLPVARWRH